MFTKTFREVLMSVTYSVHGVPGIWRLRVRPAGVSRCSRRQWGSENKAQWWWSSNYPTWGRNSPVFYTAASRNILPPHTAYFLRPRRGSSSAWTSCRPRASTDWFHSQSDKQRQQWIQCHHPWWRSGSPRRRPLCTATAAGIQLQCSSGFPQGRSTGPGYRGHRKWDGLAELLLIMHCCPTSNQQVVSIS